VISVLPFVYNTNHPYTNRHKGGVTIKIAFLSSVLCDPAAYDASTSLDWKGIGSLIHAIEPMRRDYSGVDFSYIAQVPWGTHSIRDCQDAIDQADAIICCLGPEFLASKACELALDTALRRAAKDAIHVIPVQVAPCNWKNKWPFLAHLGAIPKSGICPNLAHAVDRYEVLVAFEHLADELLDTR
jgi:hypothetical protein